MEEVVVHTKEELKEAIKNDASQIVVYGEFADKLHSTKKIATISAAGVAAIIALGGAVTLTGPIGAFAAVPVVAFTGVEIAIIIAAVSLGVALILAVYKDYEEIEYKDGRLILRKKRKEA